MFLEQNLPYSEWSAPKINDQINKVFSTFKLWGGRIGVFVLLPFALAVLVFLYFLNKRLVKRNIARINKATADFLAMIDDPNIDDYYKKWRFVSKKQIELKRVTEEVVAIRDNRKVASSLILRKFLKQEEKLLNCLVENNIRMRRILYPNANKQYTQEELTAMLYRSNFQDDLDDKDLDTSIENHSF